MTRQEIDERIEDSAKEILENCNWDLDTALENVYEEIDGYDWVIYTSKAREVVDELNSAEEDDAFSDLQDMDAMSSLNSMGDLYEKMAYVSLRKMLEEAINDAYDEHDDEDDDDEDDDEDDDDKDNDDEDDYTLFYYDGGEVMMDNNGNKVGMLARAKKVAKRNTIRVWECNECVWRRWDRQDNGNWERQKDETSWNF